MSLSNFASPVDDMIGLRATPFSTTLFGISRLPASLPASLPPSIHPSIPLALPLSQGGDLGSLVGEEVQRVRLLHESLQRAGCSCGSDGADDARAQAQDARATALPAISINASSPVSATNVATREDVAGLPPRHSASAAAVGNCTAWRANTSALLRRGECSPCRRLRYMQVLVPSFLDPEPQLVAVFGRFGFQRDVSA